MTWLLSLVDPFRNDAGALRIQCHGKGVDFVRLSVWYQFHAADFPRRSLKSTVGTVGYSTVWNTVSPKMEDGDACWEQDTTGYGVAFLTAAWSSYKTYTMRSC